MKLDQDGSVVVQQHRLVGLVVKGALVETTRLVIIAAIAFEISGYKVSSRRELSDPGFFHRSEHIEVNAAIVHNAVRQALGAANSLVECWDGYFCPRMFDGNATGVYTCNQGKWDGIGIVADLVLDASVGLACTIGHNR